MEEIRSNSYLKMSIPYKNLFLITLFCSAITFDLGTINVALGDIGLFTLDILLFIFFKNQIVITKNRKKWLLKMLIFISVIIFLSFFSLQNYMVTNYSIERGIVELIKLVTAMNYGVVFSVYFSYASKKDIQDFLRLTILSGVVVAATGVLGYFLYRNGIDTAFVMNGHRAKGTLTDTNIMAIFILTISPLIFLYYKSWKANMVFLLFIISILTTSSKAAILVSIFLVLIFLLMLFLIKRYSKFIYYLFIVSILLILAYLLLSKSTIFSGLVDRLMELTSGDVSVVTTGRTDLWGVALSILKNPWYMIAGIGYGAFANIISTIDVPVYLNNITLVHNTYLSMLVETGLITFILMISASVFLLYRTFRIALYTKKKEWVLILLSQLSLIIGMNEVNLQNNRFVYFLFIYFFFITDKTTRGDFDDD